LKHQYVTVSFSKGTTQNLDTLQLDYFTNDLEKYYLIDLACMLWSDGEIENEENYFYTHFATI
jgi:hypothetical protein